TATIKPIHILSPSVTENHKICNIINIPIETTCYNALEIDKWYYKIEGKDEKYLDGHDGENPIKFDVTEISVDPDDYINKAVQLRATFKNYSQDVI
ncbi:unnamed protein product, partial [Scytosiphon promiscuus]